jgi:hypothetical protein
MNNEEEIVEALKQGAILFVPDSGDLGDAKIIANDDLSAGARACFCASKFRDEESFERLRAAKARAAAGVRSR